MVVRGSRRGRRFVGVIASFVLMSALAVTQSAPVAHAVTPETSFAFQSDPGDYVGAGQTVSYAAPASTIQVWADLGGVHASIYSGDDSWDMNLGAPANGRLLPGYYASATRFGNAGTPSLDISGEGRGCNTTGGEFTVLRSVFDQSGAPLQLEIQFVQHCEGLAPALRGTLKYNSVPRGQYALSQTNDVSVVGQPVTFGVARPGNYSDENDNDKVVLYDNAVEVGESDIFTNFGAITTHSLSAGTHVLQLKVRHGGIETPTGETITHTVLDSPNYLWITSSARGDYMGHGLSLSVVPNAPLKMTIQSTYSGRLQLDAYSLDPSVTENWSLTVGGANGADLQPGSYTDTRQFADATHPAMSLTGRHAGCGDATGEFTINRLDRDASGVRGIDVSFTSYCASPFPLSGRMVVGTFSKAASSIVLEQVATLGYEQEQLHHLNVAVTGGDGSFAVEEIVGSARHPLCWGLATHGSGWCNLVPNQIDAGNHTVIARFFPNDTEHVTASESSTVAFRVTPAATALETRSVEASATTPFHPVTVSAVLRSAVTNNGLPGRVITFVPGKPSLGAKACHATTDQFGYATCTFSATGLASYLQAGGQYRATFGGETNYVGSSSTQTLSAPALG